MKMKKLFRKFISRDFNGNYDNTNVEASNSTIYYTFNDLNGFNR
jgi:hypothetical protein